MPPGHKLNGTAYGNAHKLNGAANGKTAMTIKEAQEYVESHRMEEAVNEAVNVAVIERAPEGLVRVAELRAPPAAALEIGPRCTMPQLMPCVPAAVAPKAFSELRGRVTSLEAEVARLRLAAGKLASLEAEVARLRLAPAPAAAPAPAPAAARGRRGSEQLLVAPAAAAAAAPAAAAPTPAAAAVAGPSAAPAAPDVSRRRSVGTTELLSRVEVFAGLSPTELDRLLDAVVEVRLPRGQAAFTQGEAGEACFVIRSGSFRVTRTREGSDAVEVIAERLSAGDVFGEMALLKDEPRMATVSATSDAAILQIGRAAFEERLGPVAAILSRQAMQRKREAAGTLRRELKLGDLSVKGTLGVGTFGRVKLVVHTATETPYALKCMRKAQVLVLKQVEHVFNERDVLAACDHPFMPALAAAWSDEGELYLLLELVLGGELFSRQHAEGGAFDQPTAAFYAANVVSAFTYLHDCGIVYRDLKPENLLIDARGFIKVVDFGFAKLINDERTHTICGTPEYLAPEIVANSGHGLGIDWWAFGVFVYELLTGETPFYAATKMATYAKIMKAEVSWPSQLSAVARDLIGKCLVINPDQRLGGGGAGVGGRRGGRAVRIHAFFSAINFAELERRATAPPFVPTISSPLDTSNFAEYEDGGGEQEAKEADEWLKKAAVMGDRTKTFAVFDDF
jgi:cGMP-dependent protein kinase